MSGSNFEIAQICINGHLVNYQVLRNPSGCTEYCIDCGAETIDECSKCEKPIYYPFPAYRLKVPSFCESCGKPYPWTESKQRAAMELFAEEISDKTELDRVEKDLNAIAANTPEAKLAWYRLDKKIKGFADPLKKLAYDVTVNVMSEVAKEALLPKL